MDVESTLWPAKVAGKLPKISLASARALLGEINAAHPAFADALEDLIPRDALADG